MLSLLTSISLAGYGLAFAIISLIVAIPYLLLRKSGAEAAPAPSAPSRRVEASTESARAPPPEILAAAIAAAIHVHTLRRRALRERTSFVGIVDPLGRDRWRAASRLMEYSVYERGWGRR